MPSLDPNLKELLVLDVTWTPKTGKTAHGQDTWGTPKVLKCYPTHGAQQIQGADGAVYTSTQSLLFDANDPDVQAFKLGDRFTSVGIGGGQTLAAANISPKYSPGPSLNEPMSAWLVEVSL